MYEYKVKSVDHIVDGDTLDVTVDLGFNISHKIRVRLYGINTPESRTRDLEEKARGLESKKYFTEVVTKWVEEDLLFLHTKKKGKYGRYLGVLYSPAHSTNINDLLVEEGYAVEYFGGKR
jgi:endonuclease YncB( thermonuclease family)